MAKGQYNLPNILILFATVALAITVTGAGCATSNNPADVTKSGETSVVDKATLVAAFKDGNYTATGNYTAPSGKEEIGVKLTLSGNKITDVLVEPKATNPISLQIQQNFAANIKAEVVGKNIDELALKKVSGASLTTNGFNSALESIKAQAK